MRTVYLDCSFGVSGDMLLASLSHCLVDLPDSSYDISFVSNELKRLGLHGFDLVWSRKTIAGLSTWHVGVLETSQQPMRTYVDLVCIIEHATLSDRVKEQSLAALTVLGNAESKVHGVELEQVHFHEIGAVDTIVDIVGTMVLMEALEGSRVVVSPIDLGSGFVQCAHGLLPVPAPACAELAKGLQVFGSPCGMERATPTGLALLRTIADSCGVLPSGEVIGVGYGSGGRSSDEQPTYVRAFALKSVAEDDSEIGETNA